MKKLKYVIAFALSLSLCAVMAGCGEDAEKKDSSSAIAATEKVTDSENDESTADSENDESAEESTEETAAEETAEEENDEFAYYNDLAEEYKNNPVSYTGEHSGALIVKSADGKILRINNAGSGFYDMETKKYIPGEFEYCDEKNLYSADSSISNIIKYDLDGNELQQIIIGEMYEEEVNKLYDKIGDEIYDDAEFEKLDKALYFLDRNSTITPNQEIINDDLMMLSADFQTFTALPKPTITEDAHGFTTELENIKVLGFSNDKLVACGSASNNGHYQEYLSLMDMNSHEWTCNTAENILSKIDRSDFMIVGKYLLSSSGLYNIETGELISDGDFSNYAGGTFSFNYNQKGHYTKDGSFVSTEDIDIPSEIHPISDTQFIYADSYGVFIRNLDDPATDVETIYLKEN